jgi:hypothetical protein
MAADPAPSATTPVHAELLHLLEVDAKADAPVGVAKTVPPLASKETNAALAPIVRASPTAAIGEPFRPALWDYFTDTGILASDHGKKVTKELTFGPCTDGELLNQRYYW